MEDFPTVTWAELKDLSLSFSFCKLSSALRKLNLTLYFFIFLTVLTGCPISYGQQLLGLQSPLLQFVPLYNQTQVTVWLWWPSRPEITSFPFLTGKEFGTALKSKGKTKPTTKSSLFRSTSQGAPRTNSVSVRLCQWEAKHNLNRVSLIERVIN